MVTGTAGSVDMSHVGRLYIESSTDQAEPPAKYQDKDILVIKEVLFDLQNRMKSEVGEIMECLRKSESCQKEGSTRWVCTLKETLTKMIPKAHLVAQGFVELKIKKNFKSIQQRVHQSLSDYFSQ